MIRFSVVTLSGAGFLGMAILAGGVWPALALLYITVFSFLMDRFVAYAAPDAPSDAEFPAGKILSTTLGIIHFPLLYGGVATLSAPDTLGIAGKIMLFIALSLFLGQVSNSNAHELIHRSNRWVRRLGAAVYTSVIFGHHSSAHLYVHHVRAASPDDTNSAHLGETFYQFVFRAWISSFCEGRAVETARHGRDFLRHPYTYYCTGAALSVGLAVWIGGWQGALWLIAVATYAQVQLLLSDYILHYGLKRKMLENGKLEPVGPAHSWNAPHWFSGTMMLNAPRHSDHHANPMRPYTRLHLDRAAMPMLPYGIPVMAMIAFWPALWRRIMDKRVAQWVG